MAYRTIHSKGDYRTEEVAAAGTITPGMLCEMTSAATVQAHSTEGGRAERLVAMEDALQGRAVSTNYSASEIVTLGLPVPGTEMAMLIASGESANIGDELVSAGDGTLKNASNLASASMNEQVIAIAVESFTTLSENTLKLVRIV